MSVTAEAATQSSSFDDFATAPVLKPVNLMVDYCGGLLYPNQIPFSSNSEYIPSVIKNPF